MNSEIHRLIDIIARLRAPKVCPWDRKQTHSSLLPCLLDETYEFFEAVDENDPYKMEEELGDLLLQVVLVMKTDNVLATRKEHDANPRVVASRCQ